jgi:hypothetical protein
VAFFLLTSVKFTDFEQPEVKVVQIDRFFLIITD